MGIGCAGTGLLGIAGCAAGLAAFASNVSTRIAKLERNTILTNHRTQIALAASIVQNLVTYDSRFQIFRELN